MEALRREPSPLRGAPATAPPRRPFGGKQLQSQSSQFPAQRFAVEWKRARHQTFPQSPVTHILSGQGGREDSLVIRGCHGTVCCPPSFSKKGTSSACARPFETACHAPQGEGRCGRGCRRSPPLRGQPSSTPQGPAERERK